MDKGARLAGRPAAEASAGDARVDSAVDPAAAVDPAELSVAVGELRVDHPVVAEDLVAGGGRRRTAAPNVVDAISKSSNRFRSRPTFRRTRRSLRAR